jgi:hypothetical protein
MPDQHNGVIPPDMPDHISFIKLVTNIYLVAIMLEWLATRCA